jgi:two-component system sensor histidine kinase BaeS
MKPFDFGSLRTRLLLGNLIVAAAGAAVVGVGVSLAAPAAFDNAMGRGMGSMGGMMDPNVSAAFGSAIVSALVLGLVAAGVVAALVSLAISSRLSRPIVDLAAASTEVAAGHYDMRVPGDSGELGELADAFNAMAASLEATERRRLELIGDVAHELRTPISSIAGYIEGLEDGVFEPGPETWRLLGDATGRLSRLVNDLSDLWRVEANDLALTPDSLDGPRVVSDAVERHRAAAAAKSIELELGECHPVSIRADRARLDQVLDNLVANAIRYTPEGGHVRVSLVQHAAMARITVADSGSGLTQEQLGRVFDRFYRTDASRSRAAGGSGLGLAIARGLTEAMGGRIWASSPGPGLGSTFGVDFAGDASSRR